MPFLGYERIQATATIKNRKDLTIPTRTDRVVVQADTADVRYLMVPEGTEPSVAPGQSNGMILISGLAPEEFSIEDFVHISFVRGSGSNGFLNIHYYASRDIR